MKRDKTIALLGLAVLTLVCDIWAQGRRSDLNSPSDRVAIVSKGEKLLTRNKTLADKISPQLRNPFVADAVEPSADVKGAKTLLPASDRERVAFLANQLSPTGSAEREGEQFLLFGQRKVKVGEVIPVAFENAQFDLEVVAIERGTFTVRLNHEEFTRPIKPGKTP